VYPPPKLRALLCLLLLIGCARRDEERLQRLEARVTALEKQVARREDSFRIIEELSGSLHNAQVARPDGGEAAAPSREAPASMAWRCTAKEDGFLLDRAMALQQLDLQGLTREARFVPHLSAQGHQVDGFKMYGLRPDSFLSSCGFRNGDVVQSVNGHSLGSTEEVLKAWTEEREAKTLRVAIERTGKQTTLEVFGQP
jgi:hypothetical protein